MPVTNKKHLGLAADLDALTGAPAVRKGPPCSIASVLASMDDNAADTLRRILDTATVSSTAIAEVLSEHGRPVTSYTVARHRRRGAANGCRCTR
ncbi:hypothetical protein OG217_05800 [Streptomyces sp. NBC_01023]|uniref:hypothetical protein n=1 Tax=Streptomyces sp. NBC_01023 TaxID=2903724 RepID=UPI003869ED35|nr:hypothetical protein OG217_05800 [Streptomyces sp. NBC_01023]